MNLVSNFYIIGGFVEPRQRKFKFGMTLSHLCLKLFPAVEAPNKPFNADLNIKS